MIQARKMAEVHIYVPNAQCLKKAIENKGLERSFKMPVDKEVYDNLKGVFENIEAG